MTLNRRNLWGSSTLILISVFLCPIVNKGNWFVSVIMNVILVTLVAGLIAKIFKKNPNTIIVFFSLFLITLEFGLRITGYYFTPSERIQGKYHSNYSEFFPNWYMAASPNCSFRFTNEEFTQNHTCNQLGFRNIPINRSDTAATSIYFLGDSFTEGFGAPADSTYSRFVQDRFNEDSLDVSIFTFGRSGSDPIFYYKILEDLVIPHQPQYVVYTLHNNDLKDILTRGGEERFLSNGTTLTKKGPWFHFFYQYSHIVRYIIHNWTNYDSNLILKSELKKRKEEAKSILEQCLIKSDSICSLHGATFIALSFMEPLEYCFTNKTLENNLPSVLDSLDGNFDKIFINEKDLRNAYPGDCSEIAWKKDGHFNAKGYQVLGNCIYEKLMPKITIK